MDNGTFGEGSWIFGLIVLLGLFGGFGGGFGGNNAAMAGFATTAEVQNTINSAFAQQNAQNILLSSANNNYETARLISDQNMSVMQQNNTNLLTAVNGFNAVSQNIANGFNSVNQNIANLGFKMEECCCGIKTMLLENRLQDTQIALQNAQNVAVNAEQSQYLLSQMGKWTPTAAAA
jgi:hypothetical protein